MTDNGEKFWQTTHFKLTKNFSTRVKDDNHEVINQSIMVNKLITVCEKNLSIL